VSPSRTVKRRGLRWVKSMPRKNPFVLILGNKNYSSWSMRAWLTMARGSLGSSLRRISCLLRWPRGFRRTVSRSLDGHGISTSGFSSIRSSSSGSRLVKWKPLG
jgi:hypothetical protein